MRTAPEIEVIDEVEQIPRNAAVGIYGAGGRGSLLMHILRERRPDIDVKCFFDDYKSGDVAGVPILDYRSERELVDLQYVLVASLSAADIIPRLRQAERFCLANISQFEGNAANDYYGNEEYAEVSGLLAQVAERLEDQASRDLFDEIVSARRRQRHKLSARFLATLGRHRQYLEHLRVERIETIVDGGLFDGSTAVQLIQSLPAVKQVYGFEPFPSFFANSPHKAVLEQCGKFVFVEAALSDSNRIVKLFFDDKNQSASRIVDDGSENAGACQALTVDEFFRDKGERVDLIKFDLEGADFAACRGSRETIRKDRPQLAISVYHSKRDLYRIPLELMRVLDDYAFFLGHYSPDIYETVLYAIPREWL